MALQSLRDPTTDTQSQTSFGLKSSFAALVEGLIQDIKHLIAQEIQLAKHEVQQELGKARTAAISIGAGLGAAILGGLLLIFMLVHLLHALTGLPLWACYGIVGGVCVAAGVFLILKGKNTAADIHVVPPKTVQTIKENATWIKDQTQSART
ncbi:MAG TPA: phage holin family protein [Nitrospiraceae bacterium]|nr:phage holin family protein [Nitrospiraceae bacterium]